MPTITPELLSGSTDGIGVTVAGTTTGTADTIHTASSTANVEDAVWLFAHNTHTGPVDLTLEWGDATRPMVVTIPAKRGAFEVIPGWKLRNAKMVKAFASTANMVMLVGHVDRYTP